MLAYYGATSVIPDMNLHEEELRRLITMADVQLIITDKEIAAQKLSWVDVPVVDAFNNCEYIKHQVIQHAVDPDEDAIAILFSSGTTSQAKGVVIGYDGEINANVQNRNVKNSGTRYVFVRKKRVQMIRR